MLSLFRFLQKHSFIVYFIFLEVIAFIFILEKNPFQRASFLNSSDYLVAEILQTTDNIDTYLNLKEVNSYLSNENSALKESNIGYFQKSFDQNIIYRDSTYQQVYSFHAAKVIRNSTNKRSNYLTLNRGSVNGVEQGMGIITDNGVVGIVLQTSKRFSAVMSVLNKDSRISAKVKKNGYFGSVIWKGKDHRIGHLVDIPNHVSLVKGDLVITSGFSGIFPENIPIGTVNAVERKQGSGFLEVEIIFSQDYQTTEHVHIVKYLHKTERENLEKNILQNDQ